jgi:hypothetical protein
MLVLFCSENIYSPESLKISLRAQRIKPPRLASMHTRCGVSRRSAKSPKNQTTSVGIHAYKVRGVTEVGVGVPRDSLDVEAVDEGQQHYASGCSCLPAHRPRPTPPPWTDLGGGANPGLGRIGMEQWGSSLIGYVSCTWCVMALSLGGGSRRRRITWCSRIVFLLTNGISG